MPLENLDEEGLPRNPDVRLAQLKFLLSIEDSSVDKDAVKAELMTAIIENGINDRCIFYAVYVCVQCIYYVHVSMCNQIM